MEKGIGIFTKQYEIMFENDPHALGSVDRILYENMIKLNPTTYQYLYESYTDFNSHYQFGRRKKLEDIVEKIKADNVINTIGNIAIFCRSIVDNCDIATDELIFGGSEEEIIERKTYWCSDIARVCCLMFQIAGFSSRIVIAVNINVAYMGHVVVEGYYNNKWGVVDPTYGIVYISDKEEPISAWQLQQKIKQDQYKAVAVVNYYCDEKESYNYTTSKVNEYYREILTNFDNNWPGGIRWIQKEDV